MKIINLFFIILTLKSIACLGMTFYKDGWGLAGGLDGSVSSSASSLSRQNLMKVDQGSSQSTLSSTVPTLITSTMSTLLSLLSLSSSYSTSLATSSELSSSSSSQNTTLNPSIAPSACKNTANKAESRGSNADKAKMYNNLRENLKLLKRRAKEYDIESLERTISLREKRDPTQAPIQEPPIHVSHSSKGIYLYDSTATRHYKAGNELRNLKRYEEAALAYACAILFDPEYALPNYYLKVTLEELTKYYEEVETKHEEFFLSSNDADCYHNALEKMQGDLKKYEEAKTVMATNLSNFNKPKCPFFKNLALGLEDLIKYEEAVRQCGSTISLLKESIKGKK